MRKKLLWADDEKSRLEFTVGFLERNGWSVDWTSTVIEAAEAASKNAYHFILVDQMLPFSRERSSEDDWGGCRLLYWLKRSRQPVNATRIEGISKLKKIKKNSQNKNTTVMILSAFFDPLVDGAINKLGVRKETKPILPEQLLEVIEGLVQEQ